MQCRQRAVQRRIATGVVDGIPWFFREFGYNHYNIELSEHGLLALPEPGN